MKFIVKDWTGSIIDFYGHHDSFEGAWASIYENFKHLNEIDFDQQMQEFYVEKENS